MRSFPAGRGAGRSAGRLVAPAVVGPAGRRESKPCAAGGPVRGWRCCPCGGWVMTRSGPARRLAGRLRPRGTGPGDVAWPAPRDRWPGALGPSAATGRAFAVV